MPYLTEEDWNRIIAKKGLKRYIPNTITDAAQLKVHLREICKKGYAFSDQEVDSDAGAVTAPILNDMGELVAGLSVAGPAYRMNKKKINDLRRLVVEYAQRISIQLGCKLKQ
jgi:DNA-binding IclR family transcriptional regulator